MNDNMIIRNQNDPYLYCDFKAFADELRRKIDLGLSTTEYEVIAAICDLPQAAIKYIDKMYGAIIKHTNVSSQSIFENIIVNMFVEESEEDWCKALKEAIDTIDISAIQPLKFIKIKHGLYHYVESQLNAEPYAIAAIATTMHTDELSMMNE